MVIPFFACTVPTSSGNDKESALITNSNKTVSDTTTKSNEVKSPTASIDCCLDSILLRYETDNLISSQTINVKVDNNNIRTEGPSNQRFDSETVVEWTNGIVADHLSGYLVTANNNEYYLFSSDISEVTGLAVNFTAWLLIDKKNNTTTVIKSLASNSKCFFFDKKEKEFVFIAFNFSEKFIHDKNFNNLLYSIETKRFDTKGKELKSGHISSCKCKP